MAHLAIFLAAQLLVFKAFGFAAALRQREAAEAVAVDVSLAQMVAADATDAATKQQAILLQRRRHVGPADPTSVGPVLALSFETNPLSGAADSVLKLATQPLEIVYAPRHNLFLFRRRLAHRATDPALVIAVCPRSYHAHLINRLASFFARPPDLALDELSAAAASRYEALTEHSFASIQYALETHKTLLLDLDVGAPTLLVPTAAAGLLLVVDLGQLRVTSTVTPAAAAAALADRRGVVPAAALEQSMYDRFDIRLTNLQVSERP